MMRRLDKRTIVHACLIVAVIVLAFFCRRIVAATKNELVEQLANFARIFLYIGLFAFWGVSVYRRVVQLQVRRYLITVSALMVFWLILREFRWHFILNAAARNLLWYAYYIPISLIPLIALFVSLSLGKYEKYRLPKLITLLYIPTALLIMLVLTNDLTQLAFVFPDVPDALKETAYTYGPVFYIITAWAGACGVSAFIVMLTKSRLPNNSGLKWLPVIPFIAAALYIILYVLRNEIVMSYLDDTTVIDCLLFTAFFESCIWCGLIQTNSRYFDLFKASVNISAQITDNDYNVRYSAGAAVPISKEDMLRAKAGPVILPGAKRLHNMALGGGRAIWTEDISKILSVRESLQETREELRERNEFLRMEYEQERVYRGVIEQNRLYDLLQSNTQPQIDQIKSLINQYRKTDEPDIRRRIIAHIVVLGSYIKRRKDLILCMEGSDHIPESKLISAFGESYYAIESMDIRGTFFVHTGYSDLPGEIVNRAYDFFESVLEAVINSARYINVFVCTLDSALRCTVQTDGTASPSALLKSYPNMTLCAEEDGGAAFILPLSDKTEGGTEL